MLETLWSHCTPVNVVIAALVIIQVWKLAEPYVRRTERGKQIADSVDAGVLFIRQNAGIFFEIVDAVARNTDIKGAKKLDLYLDELRAEWHKRGNTVPLTEEAINEAKVLARGLDAAGKNLRADTAAGLPRVAPGSK